MVIFTTSDKYIVTLGSSFIDTKGPQWPVSKLCITDQTGTLTGDASHQNPKTAMLLFAVWLVEI